MSINERLTKIDFIKLNLDKSNKPSKTTKIAVPVLLKVRMIAIEINNKVVFLTVMLRNNSDRDSVTKLQIKTTDMIFEAPHGKAIAPPTNL